MARFARVALPGCPHHITHRGNRRDSIFFDDEDRQVYLALISEYSQRHGLALWAYCLMTNHVHWIAVPVRDDSMARAIGGAHMRYARWLNCKRGWSGHLWANRYFSTALDDDHLWQAARYVEANPLRAGMVQQAQNYSWSSCAEHGGLVISHAGLLASDRPFPGELDGAGWIAGINRTAPEDELKRIRLNTQTGRPTGGEDFVKRVEASLSRVLTKQKPGPKPKTVDCETRDLFESSL